MDNTDEIRTVLLEILRIGILRIRTLGANGSGEQCSIEADHLHNLPHLVQSFSHEELLHYYTVERTSFLRLTATKTDDFNAQWNRLGKLIEEKSS